MAKIYLHSVIYATMASVPIITIIHKHLENETLQDFVIKFIKIALAMYFASEKKKKKAPKDQILPMYNN
jgi:hypothetical protein